ncbi:MAG: hypothetical protein WAO98_07890 [Alphaproteobacteria bacterium]
MNSSLPAGTNIVLDYIAENEEKFIRIYDKDKQPMVERWVYPQNFKSDQELADIYAYLGYEKPYVCDVVVPIGSKIKGVAAQNSNNPYIYQIDGYPGTLFHNERPLPPAKPLVSQGPRFILEYVSNQQALFLRLYDKDKAGMEGVWLFDVKQVQGKTPEQLRQFFQLPYLPKFVCDAIVKPEAKIQAFATSNVRQPNLYRVEAGVSFLNERTV